jgi:hypothetical protein
MHNSLSSLGKSSPMSNSNYDRIVELWSNDHDFRERLRNDPLKTLADVGIELTEEERQAVSSFDFSKFTNEEIEARILGNDAGRKSRDQGLTEEQLAEISGGVQLVSAMSHVTAPNIPKLPRFTKI